MIMKRILLFLACNSHLLLNAMTEVKVKQNSLETFEARLNEELLIESVKKNDIATVKTLLDEKVNPNYVINTGETPLSIAIERGSIGMVRVLIAADADVNKRISFRGTENCPRKIKKTIITSALILAIINQHSEIAELLIDTGAHVRAREIIHWDKEFEETSTTALMCAIKHGQANIIRKLIAKGAELTDQIEQIDFSKISNKLAIKQAIALGKKERQEKLEAEKNLTVAKLPTEAEEKSK